MEMSIQQYHPSHVLHLHLHLTQVLPFTLHLIIHPSSLFPLPLNLNAVYPPHQLPLRLHRSVPPLKQVFDVLKLEDALCYSMCDVEGC